MKKQLFILPLMLLCIKASSQNFKWAKSMGGGGAEDGRSVVIDGGGNTYTVGSFSYTVDFDPGSATFNLKSDGQGDIFISKLDASGNFKWAKKIGGVDEEYGTNVDVDALGNVYLTGSFYKTLDADPGTGTFNITSAGALDFFILKLDASGNFKWAKKIGGTDIDNVADMKVDSVGNVYSTGYFTGTADFDPGAGTYNLTATGNTDIFILKLDASGNFVWAKNFGGASNSNIGYTIAVDNKGNIYTRGSFWGTVDFNPGSGTFNLESTTNGNNFILKLDASANFVWANANKNIADYFIDVDGSGNVYTTGIFAITTDIDPGTGTYNLTNLGGRDIFILKLNASGNFVWAKSIGGTANDEGISTLDASGNIYTTGSFNGKVDFDPGVGTYNLTSTSGGANFILKLDASGNFQWAKNMGAADSKSLTIDADALGNIAIAGAFFGTTDFNPSSAISNLVSAGGADIFVLRFGSCDVNIISQPINLSANVNANVKFTITAASSTTSYQWQQNTGSGFVNISNGGQFSGTTNDTLIITGLKSSQNNYKYRCVVKGATCSDTTTSATLTVKAVSIANVQFEDVYSIYPNPARSAISIQTEYTAINSQYTILDNAGKEILKGDLNNKTTNIDISNLENGFYLIQLGDKLNKATFKLIKQ
jgi:hypothetical protein